MLKCYVNIKKCKGYYNAEVIYNGKIVGGASKEDLVDAIKSANAEAIRQNNVSLFYFTI